MSESERKILDEMVITMLEERLKLESTIEDFELIKSKHYTLAYRLMGFEALLMRKPELDPEGKVRDIIASMRQESTKIIQTGNKIKEFQARIIRIENELTKLSSQ